MMLRASDKRENLHLKMKMLISDTPISGTKKNYFHIIIGHVQLRVLHLRESNSQIGLKLKEAF